jgi:glycosyltransferase involved in cell wall biosynthesis
MSTKFATSPSAGPVRLGLVIDAGAMHTFGRIIRHLAIGLLDELVSVTAIASRSEDVSLLPSPPVEVLRFTRRRWQTGRHKGLAALSAQLAERRIEVLHTPSAAGHELVRRLAEPDELPYLVTVQGMDELAHFDAPAPNCAAVIASSIMIEAELLNRRLIPAEKVRLVRPGVHPTRHEPPSAEPERSRAIIIAGDLDDYPPFAAVLEALASVHHDGYDCVFFVMGNGRAERKLRTLARSLGLPGVLTFVDKMPPDIRADVFGGADILVYPPGGGELEMPILEGMAANVPVLVGGPCVGDFVIDGETALSFDPSGPTDLAMKLKLLLDDPSVARRMADGASTYLREHHSPARMVAALGELYRQAALSRRTLKIS